MRLLKLALIGLAGALTVDWLLANSVTEFAVRGMIFLAVNAVPLALVCLVAAGWIMATTAAFRRFRRDRWRDCRDRAICSYCGYDLRANPARCPECGGEPPEL